MGGLSDFRGELPPFPGRDKIPMLLLLQQDHFTQLFSLMAQVSRILGDPPAHKSWDQAVTLLPSFTQSRLSASSTPSTSSTGWATRWWWWWWWWSWQPGSAYCKATVLDQQIPPLANTFPLFMNSEGKTEDVMVCLDIWSKILSTRMFAYLLKSERKAYNPLSFCKTYTMEIRRASCRERV